MTKRTHKPPKPPVVPKAVRSSVVRKFKTRDRKRLLVVRIPNDGGFVIHAVSKKAGLAPVRRFPMPTAGESDIPVPVHKEVLYDLAVWYARYVARHGQAPSVRKERTRRKRVTRKAIAAFVKHQDTKQQVAAIGRPAKMNGRKVKSLVFPFICMYNPLARRKDPVFVVHKAYCSRLDQERKRTHKRHGESWVIEAKTQAEAMQLQLAEFVAEDKGYDLSDFEAHECKGDE